MPARDIDRHRRYGPTLGLATLVATGLLVGLLAFAPAPPLPPYELRAAPAPAFDARAPVQLLTVQKVSGEATRLPAVGPLADLEPENWFPIAAVPPPPAIDRRLPLAAPRFDFVPITREMLATQALFRMEPVFDALPRGLALERVVVVKVRVTEEGRVVEARVTKSLDRALDQQALQAAWQYRLAANEKGERPDWVTLPYEFLNRP